MPSYFLNPFSFLFFATNEKKKSRFRLDFWYLKRPSVWKILRKDPSDLCPCILLTWSGWGMFCSFWCYRDTFTQMCQEYLHNSLQLKSKNCVQKRIYFSFKHRWEKVLTASIKTTEALQVLSSKRVQVYLCVHSGTQGNWWGSCCFTTD